MPKQRAKLSPTGYKAARKGPKYTRSGIGAKPRKPKALSIQGAPYLTHLQISAWGSVELSTRYGTVSFDNAREIHILSRWLAQVAFWLESKNE